MNGELLTTNAAPVFIELTDSCGPMHINPERITAMNTDGRFTRIFTTDTRTSSEFYLVLESQEEILSLIEEAYR